MDSELLLILREWYIIEEKHGSCCILRIEDVDFIRNAFERILIDIPKLRTEDWVEWNWNKRENEEGESEFSINLIEYHIESMVLNVTRIAHSSVHSTNLNIQYWLFSHT